jgi:hypothetical protein
MFETSVQEQPTGTPWGIVAGALAMATFMAVGYFLVVPTL